MFAEAIAQHAADIAATLDMGDHVHHARRGGVGLGGHGGGLANQRGGIGEAQDLDVGGRAIRRIGRLVDRDQHMCRAAGHADQGGIPERAEPAIVAECGNRDRVGPAARAGGEGDAHPGQSRHGIAGARRAAHDAEQAGIECHEVGGHAEFIDKLRLSVGGRVRHAYLVVADEPLRNGDYRGFKAG